MTNKEIKETFGATYDEDGTFRSGSRWAKAAGVRPDEKYQYMKLDDPMEPGIEVFYLSRREFRKYSTVLWPTDGALTVREVIKNHQAAGSHDYGFLFRKLKIKDDLIKIMGLKGLRLAEKGEVLDSRYAIVTSHTQNNRVQLQNLDMSGNPDKVGDQSAYQWYQPDFGDMTGWRRLSKMEKMKPGDQYMVWTATGYEWFDYDSSMKDAPVGAWVRHNRMGFFARRKEEEKGNEAFRIHRDVIPEILLNMIAEDSTNPTVRGIVRKLFHVVLPVEVMASGAEKVIEYIQTNCKNMPDTFFDSSNGQAWKCETDLIRKEYMIYGNAIPPVMKRISFKVGYTREFFYRYRREDIYSGVIEVPEEIVKLGGDTLKNYLYSNFVITACKLEREGAENATGPHELQDQWVERVIEFGPVEAKPASPALEALSGQPVMETVITMNAGDEGDPDEGEDRDEGE